MSRVEIDDGWEAPVTAAWIKLAQERLGPDITADAKKNAPIGPSWGYNPKHPRVKPHQGGELKESIGFRMDGETLIVEATAPYSAYVELGTRPHIIRSLELGVNPNIMRSHALGRRQLWSLWSPVTGQYFGTEVHHPGTKPNPFLRNALYQVRGE